MKLLTFYLVRHGQTDWNVQRRLQGSNDIPLNAAGMAQAEALRPFFSARKIDAWFSSPLSRARETLRIGASIPTDIIRVDEDLREVGLGELEGLPQDEVLKRFGDDLWSQWSSVTQENAKFAFLGGESMEASNARLRACLLRLARQGGFVAAAACTHGFLMRRFVQLLDPRDPPRIIPNGLVLELAVEPEAEKITLVEIHKPCE